MINDNLYTVVSNENHVCVRVMCACRVIGILRYEVAGDIVLTRAFYIIISSLRCQSGVRVKTN